MIMCRALIPHSNRIHITCQSIHANEVDQYIKSKDGITLYVLISKGSVEEQKVLDSFINCLVKKFKRRNKNIPIYLWTDQFPLFFHSMKWFATIAYDTLRSPDPFFIEGYFYYRMDKNIIMEEKKFRFVDTGVLNNWCGLKYMRMTMLLSIITTLVLWLLDHIVLKRRYDFYDWYVRLWI